MLSQFVVECREFQLFVEESFWSFVASRGAYELLKKAM
jgi:hypothetical protein